ncbi:hypothetical protein N5P37_004373, partial [Trichoderma harzianum]
YQPNMSVSSGSPSSSGSEYTYRRPSHRRDFQIAIICALSLEYDAATLIVDEFWDQNGKQYGRTSGDTNIYRNGRIGMHNVVLMLLPNMGKAAVAGSAASLRTSYSNLRIAFLVGVCGGVPILGTHEALLGDVAIGEAIIQYDVGRQYPGEFIPKETAVATQSLPNKDIRTLLAYFKSDTGKADLRQNTARHLKALQGAAVLKNYQYSYRYPGFSEDKLFVATYRHKHRGGPSGDPCCETESYCDNAAQSSCSELGCDEKKLVQRHRSTQHGQIVLARREVTRYGARKPSSKHIPGSTISTATQTLRDSIFNFQRVLTDDQQHELQSIKVVPDAIAVLVFTAELDSLNRNRKGCSIASRLHSVLQSVRDFSAAVEPADSTHLGIASTLWGSVKLTMLVTVKSVTYDEALSKFFMDLGRICPRWTDYEIFYSSSLRLQDALHDFYASLIRCCTRAVEAVETTPRSWSEYLFTSPRESLDRGFQQDAEDLERRSRYVKDALSLAKTEAHYQNQQLRSLEMEEGSNKEKRPWGFRVKGGMHDKMESWQTQNDERQAKERKQRLLDSLSICDYLTPFKQSCRKRYRGTLEWLFHTDEFNAWISSRESPLLWCLGKIGSGKTTLTASVIEKLLTKKRNPDVFISFFFVRFDDRQSLKAEVILKSIIRQMLNVSDIFAKVETLLDNMQLNLASGLKDIEKLLQSIAAEFKTLYIVIDGLDECTQSERHDLLESLHSVMKVRSNIKLFLAGRDSVSREVQIKFSTLKQILMDCSSAQSDIATYVEGIVQEKLKPEELIVSDPDLIEDIKVALSGGANGMFLWVVFQVNELCLQHCDEDIRTAIRNFPKDLEETFNRAIDRIVSRRNEDIAKRIFRLVIAAKEPLSLNQLEEVIFVEIGQEYSRTERRSNGIAHISSWCENLVHVDEELKTVQFFHLNLEDADHYLGEICVTYLNFNDFKTTLARRQQPLPPMPPIAIAGTALAPRWKAFPSIPTLLKLNLNIRGGSTASNAIEALGSFQRDDTGDEKERMLVGHPFLGYASIHWIYHTTMFQKGKSNTWDLWGKMIVEGHDLVKNPWTEQSFYESIGPILDWAQKFHHYALIRLFLLASMLSSSYRGHLMQSAAIHEDITLLDILIEHEKSDIIIDQGCELAVQLGHLDVLDRLLAARADGQNALQAAIHSGDRKVIKRILITGVDGRPLLQIALRDNDQTTARALLAAGVDGQPALQTAAKRGHQNTIKSLLIAGADGQTALLNAASNDYPDTIKALLAAGVDGQVALQAAARSGQQSVVTHLLAAGIDGQVAVYAIARSGDVSAVTSLLDAGVDGQSLLQVVIESHDQDLVKFLLDAGVDGQPLLKAAIEKNDLTTFRTLLDAGLDVRPLLQAAIKSRDESITWVLLHPDVDGQPLLQAAIKSHDQDLIKFLLHAGVDGQPLLQAAIENRDQHILRLLLAADIDQRPALLAASESGNQDLMKLLLAAGLDRKLALQTASHRGHINIVEKGASEGGHLNVVERLLAAGAKVNTHSVSTIATALQSACKGGHLDVVKRLLAAGADVYENGKWGDALRAASQGGHLSVVEMLLAAGFEINTPNNRWRGQMALQAASRGGHLKVVERLLAAGADVNAAAGSKDETALQLAAKGGHVRIVSRLKEAGAKR